MPIASKKYPSDGAFAGCQTFWESWYLHDTADRQDPLLASSSGSSSIFDVTSQTNLPLISTLAMRLTASLE